MTNQMVVTLVVAASVTMLARVDAQQDRSWCARAEAALQDSSGIGAYHTGIVELVNCPVVGPRALAAQWRRPPSDTVAVRLLGDVSARIGDRRVMEAARNAALDRTHRRAVRLAAIEALVGQFDPSLAVAYRTPSVPGLGARAYVMLGAVDHPSRSVGAEPLPPSARGAIVSVLRELAGRRDDDEVVQKVAGYLAERLAAHLDRCALETDNAPVVLDSAQVAGLAGAYHLTLVDTTVRPPLRHQGRLTLWVQDSSRQFAGPWGRTSGPRVLGGAFDAAAPDTTWEWRRMARRSLDSPGVIWYYRFFRFGEYDAPDVTGKNLRVYATDSTGFRGRWSTDPGIAMRLDGTPEPGGYFCATRRGPM